VRKQLGPAGYRRFEEIFTRRGRWDARELVAELLEVFAAVLADDGAVEMALLRLAPMVPPAMVAAYNTQVVKYCQANVPAEGAAPAKRKAGSPGPAPARGGAGGTSKTYAHLAAAMASGGPALSQSLSQSQTYGGPGASQMSQPSKRAKLMLEAARGVPAKKDSRSVLASLGTGQASNVPAAAAATAATAKKAGAGAAAAAGAAAGGKGGKVYSCLVCMEVVQVPHAARCGHVCCKPCWEKWLNTGKTVCPLCRAPTSRDKITAVRLL